MFFDMQGPAWRQNTKDVSQRGQEERYSGKEKGFWSEDGCGSK